MAHYDIFISYNSLDHDAVVTVEDMRRAEDGRFLQDHEA